jgi:nucleotide-binding universal stress UspA family protein
MTLERATDRQIVVGIDHSGRAAYAALWAAQEATGRSIPRVYLMHAIDLPGATGQELLPSDDAGPRRASATRLLETVAHRVHADYPDLPVLTEVYDHGAVERLVNFSRRAEMTVIATRGHGDHNGLLLGSTSLRLIGHAHGPVVIVRGDPDEPPLNEIVLGVAPDQAPDPIRFAFASAARLGAGIRAIRAWTPTAGTATTDDDQAQNVQMLLKPGLDAYPDVPVTVDAVRGGTVPVLIDAARGSRLLVIGAHRGCPPRSCGPGNVVYGLLSHSATPVGVIPIG